MIMKKIYILWSILFVIAFTVNVNAQSVRIVKVDGWDPASGTDPETFNNVLFDAIDNDSTARKENPNVIFELNRGQYYPAGKTIKNYGYHLHIRAAGGSGPLPVFTPGKLANGTYGARYIDAYGDLTLENIEVNGFRPDNAVLNRPVQMIANGGRYTVKGCYFYGDRGASIVVNADSVKLYLYDSKFGPSGHRKTYGGNGRAIDLRPSALFLDTLIMVNCTNYNVSDRVIRNMGTKVNYLVLDHNTVINNVGLNGALQLGDVRYAKVTNNIFANAISMGHTDFFTAEQTQPEKHFSVISLDTIYEGQTIILRNNNIYFDQVIQDVWAKYDTVSAPYEITQTIKNAIGEANVANAWFAEPLVLKTFCNPISEFVDAFYSDPKASEYPENWCVGGEGGYFPDEIDASYGTTALSYTAADGGFPVGDLNYYPEKKSEWEDWLTTSAYGFKNLSTEVTVYPNPFSENVKIIIKSEKADLVTVSFFDITGKMINQIANRSLHSGINEIYWNGENSSGQKVKNGIYLYRVAFSDGIHTGRLVSFK
jgi:hypothetical protein